MKTQRVKSEKTRFDTRLTVREKKLFERAASLAGYRSLTDFVVKTVEERALEIIEAHEAVLASERDAEIFFNAILNPPAPNAKLKAAAERYKKGK